MPGTDPHYYIHGIKLTLFAPGKLAVPVLVASIFSARLKPNTHGQRFALHCSALGADGAISNNLTMQPAELAALLNAARAQWEASPQPSHCDTPPP